MQKSESAANRSIETTYGWVIVIASLAIHTISEGGPILLFVALKDIAHDMEVPRAVPSFAYSLMMMGTGVGGLLMGWWMDKSGIIRPVLFGGVSIALGCYLISMSDSPTSLYLSNGILLGLFGKSALMAPLVANVTRWFDKRRGLAVSIIASGQGLAGALWPPVAREMTAQFGWRESYWYLSIFMAATILPIALLLRDKKLDGEPAGPVTQSDEKGNLLIFGYKPYQVQALLWVAVMGCCIAMAMPIVHLVSHATDLGHDKATAAKMLSTLFFVGFFSRIGFGMLSDKIGAINTLVIGSACQATMLIVFSFVESEMALYAAAALFGFGFAGIMPCYPLILRMWFPVSQLGWRVAAQFLFAALGMAIGGWAGGVVFDLTGSYSQAFLLGASVNLINLIVVSFLNFRQRSWSQQNWQTTG